MVPGKAAKLENLGLNFSETSLGTSSHKIGECWDQTFCTLSKPRLLTAAQAMLDFDSEPLTFEHTLLLPKKCAKTAKSNPIFHFKERRDRVLTLTYLDSPMADFFSSKIFTFFVFGHPQGETGRGGSKLDQKKQTLGPSRFRKNSEF